MTDHTWDFEGWPSVEPDEIVAGLFQGGTADEALIGQPAPEHHYTQDYPYDVVVTLYADAQPAPWGVEELRFGFSDGELVANDVMRCLDIARYAHMRWAEGARVLVRCQQGVNRSGFVSALILMRSGMTADAAIALLRERRGEDVLNNPSFEAWLREHAHGFVGWPQPDAEQA